MDRSVIVHNNFLKRVKKQQLPDGKPPSGSLSKTDAVSVYRSGCLTRALDIKSREMQSLRQGFYTIGSSGHEGMAAVALALKVTDMAFLHYRDAAFQIQRSNQATGQTITWDMLLSFACSSDDPISGGRHKVLGSKALNIPPQTSTIASHLPKAVGAAYSIGLARRRSPQFKQLNDDAIIMCSFGDASANHSTAQGAFNTAQWTSYQSMPMPILFVCEDNGIGISTKTPKGWINATFSCRPEMRYFYCNGLDIYETYEVAKKAADYVRATRKPAFLHVRTIRLYGHAGADVATSYLSQSEVEETEQDDPLLHSVRLLASANALTPEAALEIYETAQSQVKRVAARVVERPHLNNANQVMASLIPPRREVAPVEQLSIEDRQTLFARDFSSMSEPQIMSRLIRWALTELMHQHSEIIMMGEDIGKKGGVYGVTQNLFKLFGPARVIDTLLDEQSILGLAIGAAHNGFIPIPEIQFLAYYHNAEDQIRGEASTLSFFSNGQFSNPMVIRIQGLGYQKGFGGHFHNDNSIAALRDVPGLIIACPSNGSNAVKLLRESVRLAREEQRIVAFLEPIALYPMRDLSETGDGQWMSVYPDAEETINFSDVVTHGEGKELCIVTFGNGVYLSLQAQIELEKIGISIKIVDICWLSPLPETAIITATEDSERVLIVDETRATGGLAEGLITLFKEQTDKPVKRISSLDSFIPTGPAYAETMPSSNQIKTIVCDWMGIKQ